MVQHEVAHCIKAYVGTGGFSTSSVSSTESKLNLLLLDRTMYIDEKHLVIYICRYNKNTLILT